MKDKQPWEFTCQTCGDHKLTVTHIWTILAGPVSERWQEWGLLEADHRWHYEFKERVEEKPDKEAELGDFGEFIEDDSASEPEE
jgi:5-methylcytosine-specific restriction endonuclease McrA